MTIANANNITKGAKIIEEIRDTICNWSEYADKAKVLPKLKKSITKNLMAFKI